MFKFGRVRPPDHRPSRYAINCLLLCGMAVLSFHARHLPVWLLLITAGLIAWRYLIDNQGYKIPARWVRILITVLIAVLILKQYGTLLGRDAGVGFLVGLTGLKLLETQRLRDYLMTVFLLYFLTLSAFLFSQSLLTGSYALGVGALTTVALVQLAQSGAVSLRHSVRVTVTLLGMALPLVIIMYVLFPRIQGSLWGLPQDAFASKTGLSDEVTPGSINTLLDNDEVAFRVAFTGLPPDAADLYWRSMVLGVTDGRTWRRGPRYLDGAAGLRFEKLGEPHRYTVTYEPNDKNWLVALDWPATAPARTRARSGFLLEAQKPIRQRFSYTVESYPRHRSGAITNVERQYNLKTHGEPSEQVRRLVADWFADAAQPEDIARAALTHFKQRGYLYTLTPPLLGDRALHEFLFETRRGYCEHYASAFTTLMRLAGIPARLVIGFQGGEWNEAGKYLIVRQSDAHAWSEIWLADGGWTRVDPTAVVAPERIEFGIEALRRLSASGAEFGQLAPDAVRRLLGGSWWKRVAQEARLRWDAVNTAWNNWVMAYGPERQREFLTKLGLASLGLGQIVAMMAGAVGAVILGWALIMFLPDRRMDPVLKAYG
ncbi:MAG: DUF3488 and transglutaminase-like domain-containing protein, partial [Gammaproteobacteria bacterium]|nr:DUF3488 and transglutaminase-like domain-containing protein [Gammaproteobacteria bacterium]